MQCHGWLVEAERLYCNAASTHERWEICRRFVFVKEKIMSAITYGLASVPSAKATKGTQVARPRKNLFVRFMDALAESRLQHAHREIVKHAHLFPRADRGSPIGDH
jgi:hypothetical protein